MAKWDVNVNVGTSVFFRGVEAEDADAAIEVVGEEMPYICAQCSGWGRDWSRDEWEPDWDTATAEPADEQ